MNWKLFVRTRMANVCMASLFSWRLIANQAIGIAITWGSYLMASTLTQDPALKDSVPDWLASVVPQLFWPTVVVSGIGALVACVKSALPAAIAWALIVPLYLLGFESAAKGSLLAANVAVVIYAIGFYFHGGRLRVHPRPAS